MDANTIIAFVIDHKAGIAVVVWAIIDVILALNPNTNLGGIVHWITILFGNDPNAPKISAPKE